MNKKNNLCMTRRLDAQGRIVFPIEIRKRLNIKPGDAIEIFVQGDKIVLSKFEIEENSLEQNAGDNYRFCPYCGKEI